MNYYEAINEAIERASDTHTVLGCKNIGDASSPILIYSDECPDGDGTPFQSADLDDAIDWAGDGMVGVLVVTQVYDGGWISSIEEY